MKNKNEKAITLIALVVTIIVIVILAAISINLAIGNNGIVNKAQTAKQLKDVSEVKEALELEKAPVQLKSYRVNLDSYLEQLNNGQKNFIIDYIDKIDENNAVISINSKYKFKLTDNKKRRCRDSI